MESLAHIHIISVKIQIVHINYYQRAFHYHMKKIIKLSFLYNFFDNARLSNTDLKFHIDWKAPKIVHQEKNQYQENYSCKVFLWSKYYVQLFLR